MAAVAVGGKLATPCVYRVSGVFAMGVLLECLQSLRHPVPTDPMLTDPFFQTLSLQSQASGMQTLCL
jgi:hypothetical protein